MTVSAEGIQRLMDEAAIQSDPACAETSLKEAIRLAGDANLQRLEAEALLALGRLIRRVGPARDGEALGYLHRALELGVQSAGVRQHHAVLFELGLHGLQSSDLPAALSFLHEAEQLSRSNGMDPELADVLETMGAVHYTMGQFETALEYDRQALDFDIQHIADVEACDLDRLPAFETERWLRFDGEKGVTAS